VQGTNLVRILHPALPRLQIKPGITNGTVELSWPAANSNFVLQQTSTLQDLDLWSNSTAPVQMAGDWRVATQPVAPPPRFFRLKSAP